MKLDFDFATAPHAIQPWVWWLLVASILVSGFAVWQYAQLQPVRDGMRLRLEHASAVKAQPAKVPLSPEARTVLKEQVKQANAVLVELGRPWPAMLAQLESVSGPEIALLTIRPDAGKGRIRLIGEARNLTDALDYVRSLSTPGSISDVVLEQHEVVESDPQKPIRFVLSARWGRS